MDNSDVITEIGNKKRQTFFEEGNEFSLVFTKSEVALGHLGTAKCDSQHERERVWRSRCCSYQEHIWKTAFAGQDWHGCVFLQYGNPSQRYLKETKQQEKCSHYNK